MKLSTVTVVDAAAVATPVLAIEGECDRMMPADVVPQTAAQFRHPTVVKIPGANQLLNGSDLEEAHLTWHLWRVLSVEHGINLYAHF